VEVNTLEDVRAEGFDTKRMWPVCVSCILIIQVHV